MVHYIKTMDELERLLKKTEILLVAFISRNDESRSISYAVRMFEKLREPMIVVAIIDTTSIHDEKLLAEASVTPLVRLYVNGELVFEQKGGMGFYQKDFIVLKEGIKSVLAGRGIRLLL